LLKFKGKLLTGFVESETKLLLELKPVRGNRQAAGGRISLTWCHAPASAGKVSASAASTAASTSGNATGSDASTSRKPCAARGATRQTHGTVCTDAPLLHAAWRMPRDACTRVAHRVEGHGCVAERGHGLLVHHARYAARQQQRLRRLQLLHHRRRHTSLALVVAPGGAARQPQHVAALLEAQRVHQLEAEVLMPERARAGAAAQPAREQRARRVHVVALGHLRSAMGSVANRSVRGFAVGDRSRGRFVTPAEPPLLNCSPYSHAHVRRERLGFVHRSRAISVAPCQTLTLRFATFASLYSPPDELGACDDQTGPRRLRSPPPRPRFTPSCSAEVETTVEPLHRPLRRPRVDWGCWRLSCMVPRPLAHHHRRRRCRRQL
jgi:hypothetical protein